MGKIFIGEVDKIKVINEYVNENKIEKVYVIGEDLGIGEHIKFADTIEYKYFYKLLQEVNQNSLVVLNECLRKQNRYDLTYNCIRRYVLQTPHKLIFNYYPIIKEQKDFMILYDMIQNNPFLKEKYEYVTKFEDVEINRVVFDVEKTNINLQDLTNEYQEEKEKIILQVNKDPDIIPRRLLKFVEKYKPKGYDRIDKIKPIMRVAVSQFGVDQYYYNELLNFKKELENVIQRIHG